MIASDEWFYGSVRSRGKRSAPCGVAGRFSGTACPRRKTRQACYSA